MSTEERVKKIISDEFGIDTAEIDRETIAADVDGWDSLRHTVLISKMEMEFSCQLSVSEITSLECVGDLIDAFERHTA